MAKDTREKVKSDILDRMKAKGLTSPVYMSKLDDYMNFYDKLQGLLVDADSAGKITDRINCLKESRQMENTMLNILDWLGIKPDKEDMADYDL